MAAKLITETEAKKMYEAGRKVSRKGYDNLREAVACGEYNGPLVWSYMAAWELGYNGAEWKIEEFRRYGQIPATRDGYAIASTNYRDDFQESGVSVVTEEWEQSIPGMLWISLNAKSKTVITFSGIRTGTGSDGEPVVLPIQTGK